MQKPMQGPVRRALNWVLVPLVHPEYRRLVTRSFILTLRLELLSAFTTVVTPFATPGLLLLIRRRSEHLRADVSEFSRHLRTCRIEAAQLTAAHSGGFRNPWT